MVDRYVVGRAEAKAGKKADSFDKKPAKDEDGAWIKDKKTGQDRLSIDFPEDFRDAMKRVCSDLLIETLMTPPPSRPAAEKKPCWEAVKTIALVARSFQIGFRDTRKGGTQS